MGKKTIVEKLKEYKKNMSKKLKIDKMIFFGSRAKGKAGKYSDVDLIVVSQKFKNVRFVKRSFEFYKGWDLDYPVDILCYTPKEFNSMNKKETIVKYATKEGIVL